jgi:hypothetical protein
VDEILDELRARAAEDVREGFRSRADIIANLIEVANTDYDVPPDDRIVTRLVDAELLEHYGRQQTWAEPTDCDKLDAAFAAMEKRGLVARQNFSSCNTCARAEIWDEIAAAEESREVIGYAFYHMQDTERAVGGGAINIKFWPTIGAPAEEVGQHIHDALLECGVDAGWSGSADDAVQVGLTDWRKRRANELPLTDEPEQLTEG